MHARRIQWGIEYWGIEYSFISIDETMLHVNNKAYKNTKLYSLIRFTISYLFYKSNDHLGTTKDNCERPLSYSLRHYYPIGIRKTSLDQGMH